MALVNKHEAYFILESRFKGSRRNDPWNKVVESDMGRKRMVCRLGKSVLLAVLPLLIVLRDFVPVNGTLIRL